MDLGDLGRACVHAQTGLRHALEASDRANAAVAVLEAEGQRLADASILDREGLDEALSLEDLSDVHLEVRRRQRDLVVHRRVGVAQTRQHVGDRVGHRHGWFSVLVSLPVPRTTTLKLLGAGGADGVRSRS